ncbi:30S ribosomal protein S18 [Candidatus Dojkabacteria bacterium]|nr:30S ribosomal protein S18 [Candidatus Dojkabacteria bacterium]
MVDLARERNLEWTKDAVATTPKRGKRPNKKLPANTVCPLCEGKIKTLSYKDVYQLKRFISVRGKIIGRAKSGVCAKHQRQLAKAVKRARQAALLPYSNIE